MHDLVKDIIRLQNAGKKTEAEARYEKLDAVSASILHLLDAVEQRVQGQFESATA